ncbi:hypothetical protein TWF281_007179 [Arthrobotrys megalospora]
MYSLQLRRGIARGRIWQTSALYQSAQVNNDDVHFFYGSSQQQPVQQQQTRGFHGSRRLCEDEKKDDDQKPGEEAAKPRVIPKMNFAELMKKAATLRQSVFKKPPEASATFNPAAPPPPPSSSSSAAAAPQQTVYNNNNQYSSSATATHQPQLDPNVTFKNANTAAPRIRRYAGGSAEIPTDLISSAAQQEQASIDRRAARLAKHKARLMQEQSQPSSQRRRQEEPQPLTISDREAQAQDRAFAQAGAFVRGAGSTAAAGGGGGGRGGGQFTIKRVGSVPQQQHSMTFQERLRLARVARGISPEVAEERRQREQDQQRAFEEGDEDRPPIQPRITALPVRTGPIQTGAARGARTSRAQGPRGAAAGAGGGRGGGGGGRGRGGRGRRGRKAMASFREAERLEELGVQAAWLETTGNPKPAPPGTIEPHPVYDSTKPYLADVGDLSRWIPAMAAGNSEGAKKLQWVGKPKGEKMLEYAPKALLGDGILIPGEVWKYKFGEKGGVKVTGEVEKALSTAEAGLMRNPTILGKNQAKFLDVIRGKVGLGEARV